MEKSSEFEQGDNHYNLQGSTPVGWFYLAVAIAVSLTMSIATAPFAFWWLWGFSQLIPSLAHDPMGVWLPYIAWSLTLGAVPALVVSKQFGSRKAAFLVWLAWPFVNFAAFWLGLIISWSRLT